MAISPYAIYSSILTSVGVWESLVPYVIWGQVLVFLCLLLVATVGRRLRLRRKYVDMLDEVFRYAAVNLRPPSMDEEDDEEEFQEYEEAVVICPESPRADVHSSPESFDLQDTMPYLAAGMRAVVQDCVSTSFTSAELRTWNMLSRTKHQRKLRMTPSLTIFWAWGVVIRYVFLFPMRLIVLMLSLATLVVLCSTVGLLPNTPLKKKVNAWVVCWCFDFVAGSISVVARFHDKENRPTHGIAVANHTSPIDSMVLATDQCYDMVGQKATGILGTFMTALSKSSTHIWFERTNSKDRSTAAARLQAHAQNPELPPILIFPEGTCVNNTALLQFKKGAFEIDSVIYPIAIRFDPRYGDPFWWQDSFGAYILYMMTSWAIVCDVYYLPPMYRKEGESAAIFANRVKALIAHRGGFVDLVWDGFIKLHSSETMGKKKQHWRGRQQQEYAKHISREERQD